MKDYIKPPRQPIKPVIDLQFPDGHITRVWMINPGESIKLGEPRSMQFPHDPSLKTASLIYETIGTEGHSATEYDIRNPGTWEWIQQWMEKGLRAEKLM